MLTLPSGSWPWEGDGRAFYERHSGEGRKQEFTQLAERTPTLLQGPSSPTLPGRGHRCSERPDRLRGPGGAGVVPGGGAGRGGGRGGLPQEGGGTRCCRGKMAAAEVAALRLSRQEQELRRLTAEVGRLKEREAPCCPGSCSPELQRLRAENEKLRYRLLHLRRSLAAELGRAAAAEQRPPGRAAAEPPAGGEVVAGAGAAPGPSWVRAGKGSGPGRTAPGGGESLHRCGAGRGSAGREGAGGTRGGEAAGPGRRGSAAASGFEASRGVCPHSGARGTGQPSSRPFLPFRKGGISLSLRPPPKVGFIAH